VSDLPPLPEYARGDWREVSPVIGFTKGGAFGVAGTLGPNEVGFTRETFIRGTARILYGERADEVVEHWRLLNAAQEEPPHE
jgi:hypothetical protein